MDQGTPRTHRNRPRKPTQISQGNRSADWNSVRGHSRVPAFVDDVADAAIDNVVFPATDDFLGRAKRHWGMSPIGKKKIVVYTDSYLFDCISAPYNAKLIIYWK